MMAADCMVMPRALSAGRKSVTVEPSSTSAEVRIGVVEMDSWLLPNLIQANQRHGRCM